MLPLLFTVLIHCMQHHKPQTIDGNPSSFLGLQWACVKWCSQQTERSWLCVCVCVFPLCSNGLTVCSMRLLIVLKCRVVFWGHAAEKSAAGVMSAWKSSIPSSSLTPHSAVPPLKHPLQTSATPQMKILNHASFAGQCKVQPKWKLQLRLAILALVHQL